MEVIAQDVARTMNPNLEQIRGPSNDAGDDGLFRDTKTGRLLTVESKFVRQQNNISKGAVVNLDEAGARNGEMYGAESDGLLVTTSGDTGRGAKQAVRQAASEGRKIEIVGFTQLQNIARNPETDPDLAQRIEAALKKKARRVTSQNGDVLNGSQVITPTPRSLVAATSGQTLL